MQSFFGHFLASEFFNSYGMFHQSVHNFSVLVGARIDNGITA